MQKTALKTSQYSKTETILKIGENGQNARAIVFRKRTIWVKNSNCQKDARNNSTSTLQWICEENSSRNQLIFEKWDHFDILQKWSLCKECKPLENGQFGSKIKIAKTGARNDATSKWALSKPSTNFELKLDMIVAVMNTI